MLALLVEECLRLQKVQQLHRALLNLRVDRELQGLVLLLYEGRLGRAPVLVAGLFFDLLQDALSLLLHHECVPRVQRLLLQNVFEV